MGKREGTWGGGEEREAQEGGQRGGNKRPRRAPGPQDGLLLQGEPLAASITGAKPRFSVVSFQVTSVMSAVPFLSASLCVTARVRGPKAQTGRRGCYRQPNLIRDRSKNEHLFEKRSCSLGDGKQDIPAGRRASPQAQHGKLGARSELLPRLQGTRGALSAHGLQAPVTHTLWARG